MLNLEQLKLLAEKIDAAVKEAGLDHDQLFEEARGKAWEKAKREKPNFDVH